MSELIQLGWYAARLMQRPESESAPKWSNERLASGVFSQLSCLLSTVLSQKQASKSSIASSDCMVWLVSFFFFFVSVMKDLSVGITTSTTNQTHAVWLWQKQAGLLSSVLGLLLFDTVTLLRNRCIKEKGRKTRTSVQTGLLVQWKDHFLINLLVETKKKKKKSLQCWKVASSENVTLWSRNKGHRGGKESFYASLPSSETLSHH